MTGKLVLQRERVNLNQFLQKLCAIVKHNKKRHSGVELITRVFLENDSGHLNSNSSTDTNRNINTNSNIIVLIDEQRLLQLLVNLVSNALSFTTHGTVLIEIQVLDQVCLCL